MTKRTLNHYCVTVDDDVVVEVLVEPDVRQWNDESLQMEVHDELVEFRVVTGGRIIFRRQGTEAHNLIVNLVDMLNETKVGELPF